ncbi:MAG: T9SS type A sorting domain-containing protein [Ferruginibacter sp.]
MKRILLSGLICIFSYFSANATVWPVQVSNFQFSPANLNVVVGDVIEWYIVSGFHNSTSTSVPAGANPWASNSSLTPGLLYSYTVTAAGSYEYICSIHGLAMTASFTASGSAPVKLRSFEVTDNSNKPVIKWITETETNTQYFSLRKSNTGNNFSEIMRIPAAGNSTEIKNYSYTDNDITADEKFVYYELLIVDIDGKTQRSPIKLYRNNAAAKKIILSLSPNPVSAEGHFNLSFNADKEGEMQASIMDIQGKIVFTSSLSAKPGINKGHLHIANLPAGNYAIQFLLDGATEIHRFSKQ